MKNLDNIKIEQAILDLMQYKDFPKREVYFSGGHWSTCDYLEKSGIWTNPRYYKMPGRPRIHTWCACLGNFLSMGHSAFVVPEDLAVLANYIFHFVEDARIKTNLSGSNKEKFIPEMYYDGTYTFSCGVNAGTWGTTIQVENSDDAVIVRSHTVSPRVNGPHCVWDYEDCFEWSEALGIWLSKTLFLRMCEGYGEDDTYRYLINWSDEERQRNYESLYGYCRAIE